MNQHTKEIKFDRQSREYSVTVDQNFLGFARNYADGDIMADNYITELEILEAGALSPEEVALQWMTEQHKADFAAVSDEPTLPAPVQGFLEALDAPQPIMQSLTFIHPFTSETMVVTVFAPVGEVVG